MDGTQLISVTPRIFYLEGESETDRPNLYYILCDGCGVAVDAGNSSAHVGRFYGAIEAA